MTDGDLIGELEDYGRGIGHGFASAGTVTVENTGLGGVTVRLSGMADAQTATDNNGQYSFTGLRAGTYAVEISGFDMDEVGFGSVSGAATVGVGESKIVSFDGTYLRTAGIMGQVSVEGTGLAGVTVSLAGEGEDATTVTDAGGQYAFSKLRAGDYSVAISGYDTDDYEFETTSMSVSVALGETANVPFDGVLLRTAGISGRVSVEGMGISGVTVNLAGAAEASTDTDASGQYAFAGLVEGTYVVSMSNPDETAYDFETTTANVELGDSQAAILNFEGTHTRTASVSGVLFLDEAPKDGMYTANEPMLAHAGVPVALQGPGVTDVALSATDSTGAFMFGELRSGSYRVLVNMTEEVAAAITAAGFAFAGDLTGTVVNVAAGATANVAFPFNIVTQTIGVGARMGVGEVLGHPVAGVELSVYANADMTGELGSGTTDEMGVAAISFARADNTGPGGNDNLVFVSVKATGHDDLAVSDNSVIEVAYPGTVRVHPAPAAVTLANTRANFQYWVKSDEMARGGNMGLEDWNADVYMGDTEAEDAMPLEDGPDATDEDGLATFTYAVTAADLPATFTVMVADGQSSEMYDQSDALVHTHTGLMHPAMNSMEMNDLGPIYVTWTTQTLTVGVYREIDDEPGFTDYRAPMGGDDRPHADVAKEMTAELLARDDRDRLRRYEYDHDGKESTDDIGTMGIGGTTGMASFPHLPADMEFTVRLHVGSDRMLVGETDSGDMETFGADLDIGMSTGSFGDMGGGLPEVMLCSATTDRSPTKGCATWAYQWETGSVSGSVSGPGGASVSLTAMTDADDRGTKTSTARATFGRYSISGIQDGEYELTTPNTADNTFSPKGGYPLLEIYHDEEGEKEEDDESEYVGTAWDEARNFTATKQRLSIKGYVANDGGRDGRARGNEAMSGVTVNLLRIAKATDVSPNKKDTTFTSAGSTTTDGSGFYEFNDLADRSGPYFVQVTAGDEYMGLRAVGNNKSAGVQPDQYPALSEPFKLPGWNYMTNTVTNATPLVSAPPPSTVSATLQNFALIYTTSNVSGSVTNMSGSNAGILVEAAMCETYTADDPATGDVNDPMDEEHCEWGDVMRTQSAGRGGSYEFDGLLEGYYAVWFTGGGLAAANVNDMGRADDDGDTLGAEMYIKSVMGRNQYSTGNNFTVYTSRPGFDDDDLTSLEVRGVTTRGDTTTTDFAAAIDFANVTQDDAQGTNDLQADGTVTFAAGGVSIDTEQSDGASARAMLTTAVPRRSPSNLPFNATPSTETDIATEITVRVTAANGYNDHDYTFSVTRTDPADNSPTSVAVGAGNDVTFNANNIASADVGATDATADVVVTLKAGQTVAVAVGGETVAGTADDTNENLITFTVSTAVGQTAVNITVTSEDKVDARYTLNLVRPSS